MLIIVQSIILHSKTIYTVKDILFCYDYCILLPNSHNTSYIKLASSSVCRSRIVGENLLRFHSLNQALHSFCFVLFETISYFTLIFKHNCDLKRARSFLLTSINAFINKDSTERLTKGQRKRDCLIRAKHDTTEQRYQ